jgi:hypothetical protein
VETINSEPALQHIVDFAREHVGVAKDLGSRFNMALFQFDADATAAAGNATVSIISGAFAQRNNDWAPFPSQFDTGVTYTFSAPGKHLSPLTAPWHAKVGARADITSSDAFKSEWYAAPPALADASATSTAATSAAAAASAAPLFQRPTPPPAKACVSAGCFTLLIENGDGVHFYTMDSHKKTVVMYLDTFEPKNATSFEETVAKGLAIAHEQDRDDLIIDLSQNGGGDICLGRKTLSYVLDLTKHGYGPTDMPVSPLSKLMAEKAVEFGVAGDSWSPDTWTNDDGKPFSTDSADWLLDGRHNVLRGVHQRDYSQLLHLSTEACSYDPAYKSFADSFASVRIVTRGLCGSTCAFFADHAAQFDHVETIAVGGLHGRAMQYTSFPGLQVLDTPGMWTTFESYVNTTTTHSKEGLNLVPQPLSHSARYRFTIRQIYPHGQLNRPTEYTFQPADRHLMNTVESATDPAATWFNVADEKLNADDNMHTSRHQRAKQALRRKRMMQRKMK